MVIMYASYKHEDRSSDHVHTVARLNHWNEFQFIVLTRWSQLDPDRFPNSNTVAPPTWNEMPYMSIDTEPSKAIQSNKIRGSLWTKCRTLHSQPRWHIRILYLDAIDTLNVSTLTESMQSQYSTIHRPSTFVHSEAIKQIVHTYLLL